MVGGLYYFCSPTLHLSEATELLLSKPSKRRPFDLPVSVSPGSGKQKACTEGMHTFFVVSNSYFGFGSVVCCILLVLILGGGSYRGAVRDGGRGSCGDSGSRGVVVAAGRTQAPSTHRVHAEAHGAGVGVRGHALRGVRVPAVRPCTGAAQPLTTRLQGAALGGLT